MIHIFRVMDEGRAYVTITKFTGHFDVIKTMDWSADAEQLRAQTSDDVVKLNVSNASQTHTSSDITWATRHCTCSGVVILRDSTPGFDVIAEGRRGGILAIVKKERHGNLVRQTIYNNSFSDLARYYYFLAHSFLFMRLQV